MDDEDVTEYSTVRLARSFRLACLAFTVGLAILALEALVVEHSPITAAVYLAAAVGLAVLGVHGMEPATLAVRPEGLVITNGDDAVALAWSDISGIDPRHPSRNQLPVLTTADGRVIVLKALRRQPASVARDLERRLLDRSPPWS